MLRSLVGSEMCIRDSYHPPHFVRVDSVLAVAARGRQFVVDDLHRTAEILSLIHI